MFKVFGLSAFGSSALICDPKIGTKTFSQNVFGLWFKALGSHVFGFGHVAFGPKALGPKVLVCGLIQKLLFQRPFGPKFFCPKTLAFGPWSKGFWSKNIWNFGLCLSSKCIQSKGFCYLGFWILEPKTFCLKIIGPTIWVQAIGSLTFLLWSKSILSRRKPFGWKFLNPRLLALASGLESKRFWFFGVWHSERKPLVQKLLVEKVLLPLSSKGIQFQIVDSWAFSI